MKEEATTQEMGYLKDELKLDSNESIAWISANANIESALIPFDKETLDYLQKPIDFQDLKHRIEKVKVEEKSKNDLLPSSSSMISPWVPKESYSARKIEVRDNKVILELVIDLDEKLTEEREFSMIFFNENELENSTFYKVRIYERPGEQRLVVENASGFVDSDHFPKIDFGKFDKKDLFF